MNGPETIQEKVDLPMNLARRVKGIAADLRCPVAEVLRMAILKGLAHLDIRSEITASNSAAVRKNKKT